MKIANLANLASEPSYRGKNQISPKNLLWPQIQLWRTILLWRKYQPRQQNQLWQKIYFDKKINFDEQFDFDEKPDCSSPHYSSHPHQLVLLPDNLNHHPVCGLNLFKYKCNKQFVCVLLKESQVLQHPTFDWWDLLYRQLDFRDFHCCLTFVLLCLTVVLTLTLSYGCLTKVHMKQVCQCGPGWLSAA